MMSPAEASTGPGETLPVPRRSMGKIAAVQLSDQRLDRSREAAREQLR